MSVLRPQRGGITLPPTTALSRPFWDGCARSELLFQRCADCGGATHTPAVVCAHCTSTALSWERSSGDGEIYTWTTVWRPVTPQFTAPYVAIVVELDEGWHMVSNLVGCEPAEAAVGLPVAVTFAEVAHGRSLPYFRPRS